MTDEPAGSLLLMSGSTRDGSINTAVLKTATTVLAYTGATIVDEACLDIPVGRPLIGAAGKIDDPTIQN